jgi:NAD(P)-dependent dehydrogenase (short-subunit alcohol dehydrogenase family)
VQSSRPRRLGIGCVEILRRRSGNRVCYGLDPRTRGCEGDGGGRCGRFRSRDRGSDPRCRRRCAIRPLRRHQGDVAKAVAKTIDVFGKLDGAVNNAGTDGGIFFPTAEYPIAVFDMVMSINVRGVFLCLHHELKVMAERGSGSIVNMGSIASAIGAPNRSAYIASKHAVLGLTRTAALEYANAGIRVNAVGPGFVETPMVMDRGLQARPGTEAWQAIANIASERQARQTRRSRRGRGMAAFRRRLTCYRTNTVRGWRLSGAIRTVLVRQSESLLT